MFRRLVSKSLVRSSREVGLPKVLAGNVITCLETLVVVSAVSINYISSGVVVTLERNILRLRCNCNED